MERSCLGQIGSSIPAFTLIDRNKSRKPLFRTEGISTNRPPLKCKPDTEQLEPVWWVWWKRVRTKLHHNNTILSA